MIAAIRRDTVGPAGVFTSDYVASDIVAAAAPSTMWYLAPASGSTRLLRVNQRAQAPVRPGQAPSRHVAICRSGRAARVGHTFDTPRVDEIVEQSFPGSSILGQQGGTGPALRLWGRRKR